MNRNAFAWEPVVSLVRISVFGSFVWLALLPDVVIAQELPAPARDDAEPMPAESKAELPDAEQELARLLTLTRQQQKERARELIEQYPNTELARTLERLLEELAEYDRLATAEQQARDTLTAYHREYWRAYCCPLPAWSPQVGEIRNSTDEPILYEIRYNGIHRTRWMGPYRLSSGGSYASSHPYFVRYITSDGVRELVVSPGEGYTFQGVPGTASFTLAPGLVTSPAPPAPALPMTEE